MSEMIDRIADAMVASRPVPEGHFRGVVDWSAFRDYARAALEAMREPTKAMIAQITYYDTEYDQCTDEMATEQWQKMIDEALK